MHPQEGEQQSSAYALSVLSAALQSLPLVLQVAAGDRQGDAAVQSSLSACVSSCIGALVRRVADGIQACETAAGGRCNIVKLPCAVRCSAVQHNVQSVAIVTCSSQSAELEGNKLTEYCCHCCWHV